MLIQVAVPSREGIGEYQALGSEINELVGEINGEFGTADWTPIMYLRHSVDRPELAALYAAAEVAWVLWLVWLARAAASEVAEVDWVGWLAGAG